jgi:hypothetical protein
MDSSFFDPGFAMLGGQMARAWQKALETWWTSLLGDRARLGELARQLRETDDGASVTADQEKVVQALELIQTRQKALEGQMAELTRQLADVVTILERSTPRVDPDDGPSA